MGMTYARMHVCVVVCRQNYSSDYGATQRDRGNKSSPTHVESVWDPTREGVESLRVDRLKEEERSGKAEIPLSFFPSSSLLLLLLLLYSY